jgi:hypothetical protein
VAVLRIEIADAGDAILDSNVYTRCTSFIVPVRRSSRGGLDAIYRWRRGHGPRPPAPRSFVLGPRPRPDRPR